jgi:hypothetical protein
MATSLQKVANRTVSFKDIDLIAFVILASECLLSHASAYPTLRPRAATWTADLKYYGTGIINLRLDDIARSDVTRQEFLDLLSNVRSRAAEFGDSIPPDFLNDRCPAPGVEFRNFPTALLLTAIDRLRALFE